MNGEEILSLMLAIAMLGVAALIGGGIAVLRKGGDKKRGGLMLAAALVLFVNVVILAWPR